MDKKNIECSIARYATGLGRVVKQSTGWMKQGQFYLTSFGVHTHSFVSLD